MPWISEQEKRISALCGTPGQVMNFFYKGAGSVYKWDSQAADFLLYPKGHSMGPQHQRISWRNLSHRIHHLYSLSLQLFHQLGVVEQRSQGGHPLPLLQQGVHHVHRPLGPEAEPRAPGKLYFHHKPPFYGISWPPLPSYSKSLTVCPSPSSSTVLPIGRVSIGTVWQQSNSARIGKFGRPMTSSRIS